MPTEDARLNDRLPWVTVCVEAVANTEHRCAADRTTIERSTRTARIVIGFSRDPADHRDPAGDPANRAAWRNIEFTTDLDQVRWLR